MTEVKIIGKNTECFIDKNGVMTISGENINIVENVVNEESSRELSKWIDEVDSCVKKCKKCSCTNMREFIKELQDNTEFQKIIKEVVIKSMMK